MRVGEALGYKVNTQVKYIKPTRTRRVTKRDRQLEEEFTGILKVIGHRSNNEGEREYHWFLGPFKIWNTLPDAVSDNFRFFIKHAHRYR